MPNDFFSLTPQADVGESGQKHPPHLIEFAGLPRTGKTTCVESLASFLRHQGFHVGSITDRGNVCPIVDKLTPEFNAWTILAVARQFLELKSAGVHVVLADRGLFDGVVWLRMMMNTDRTRKEIYSDLRHVSRSFLWWQHQKCTFVLRASIPAILERDAERRIYQTTGTIVKESILQDYRQALDEEVHLSADEGIAIHVIDTDTLSMTSLLHRVADLTLATLEN